MSSTVNPTADASTEITNRYLDGQTESITGTGVVARYFDYGTDSKTEVITDAFIARNAKRKDIANFDKGNFHYSWDWDQVHFVQLNLFAGFEMGPESSAMTRRVTATTPLSRCTSTSATIAQ